MIGGSARILLGNDRVEFRFRVFSTRLKTVVPDIKWFQLAAESLLDLLGYAWDERRTEHLAKHFIHTRFWNLAVLVEATCDQRWRSRRVWICLASSLESGEQMCITPVRFSIRSTILTSDRFGCPSVRRGWRGIRF